MDILIYILLLVLFFFLSWVFNGFETGIISLDRFELEQAAKKSKLKKRILDFYDRSDKTFGTTLIGYNISHVIIAAVSTVLFVEILGINNTYATLVITFALLILCEIIPKNLFRDYPDTLIDGFFPLIYTSYLILKPVVKIISFINLKIKKLFKTDDTNPFSAFSKDDLAFIVAQTFEDGKILKPQKEMLEDALEFNELDAKNIMTPRLEIVAIPDTMPYPEIMKFISAEGYTRYPVYHETLDEITGVLIAYDLLKIKNKSLTAKNIQREMFFVPESMGVNVLLKAMQTHKKSIAVVVDSFGGTSGIVTIEDILEEIVGDIEDEYDIEDSRDIEKIDENTWLINALVKVDELNEELNINLPEGEYETIAGLLIDKLAKIPSRGQKITIDGCKFEIIEVTNRRIKKVRLVVSG